MSFISDNAFDGGLDYLTTYGARVDICSQEPTSYTEATSTYTLGNKSGLTIGATQDGAVNGRRVVIPAIADGAVTGAGTATHWALTGNSELLAAEALTPNNTVASGEQFALGALSVVIGDADSGLSASDLYVAVAALSEGESATFSAGAQSAFSEAAIEWQTSFWHDSIFNRIHVLGKAAGTSASWTHQYYDIASGTWVSVTSSLTGGAERLGHIYGNTGFNWSTGDLYQQAGDATSQKELYHYDPGANSWSTETSDYAPTISGGGMLSGNNNGVGVHPELFGSGRPGVIIANTLYTMFYDLADGSDYEQSHSSQNYGSKEGGWVYWPQHDCVVIGGSALGNGRLEMIEPNGQATPISTELNEPPINVQGASQANSTGFGSLHVHPGNPAKLLLLETTGSRAWTGTLSGSTITWTQIGDHPFTQNARILCSLRDGLGCMWMIARDDPSDYSVLWKPPA